MKKILIVAGVIVLTTSLLGCASSSAEELEIEMDVPSTQGGSDPSIQEEVIPSIQEEADAANQNVWIEAMGPYLEETYPNMSWVGGGLDSAVFHGDDDPTKSVEQFNAILSQYPEVGGIIAPTTVGVLAAAQEKKAKGVDVAVTGLGLPSEMAPYIEDGTIAKVGLQGVPNFLSYVGVYLSYVFESAYDLYSLHRSVEDFDSSTSTGFQRPDTSDIFW